MTQELLKLALEALELAQDNLREHGDNCFLHDEGEYNRCFCGKDSLSDHLQSVAEKLDEALAQEQEPVAWISTGPARMIHWTADKPAYGDDWVPLYTTTAQAAENIRARGQ